MTPRDRPDYPEIGGVHQNPMSKCLDSLIRDLDLAHARIEELSAEIASLRAALTFTKDERDRLEGNHPCP